MRYTNYMELLFIFIALVMSLTLHELMHALVGSWLGDTTARTQGRISLNPLRHIDPFATLLLPALLILAHSPVIFGAAKPVPFNPWALRYGKWGAALLAAAGPLTNLALACFMALWINFVPLGDLATQFFITAISMNVGFFVFNMIPFPPLDGSRVLYAVAPRGLRDVMDKVERAGLAAIVLFMLVGFRYIAPLMSQIVGAILRVLLPGLSGL